MLFVCVVGTMGDLSPFIQLLTTLKYKAMVFACPEHSKYVKSKLIPFRSININLADLVDDCLEYDYPLMSTTWLWSQYRKQMPAKFKAANAKIAKYITKYKPKLVLYNSPFCGLRNTLNNLGIKHLEIMHFPYNHETPGMDHPLLYGYRDSMTHNAEDTWSVFRGLSAMMDTVVNLTAPDTTKYAYVYDPAYAPGDHTVGFVWPPNHNFEPSKQLIEFTKFTTVYVTLSACPAKNQVVINRWLETTYLNVLVYGLEPVVKRPNIMYQDCLIDHHWLIPRVKCVLNYGGIGTVAMSLRYRTPMVVWPMSLDRHFNAARLLDLKGGLVYDPKSDDLDSVVKSAILEVKVPVIEFRCDGLSNLVRIVKGMLV